MKSIINALKYFFSALFGFVLPDAEGKRYVAKDEIRFKTIEELREYEKLKNS